MAERSAAEAQARADAAERLSAAHQDSQHPDRPGYQGPQRRSAQRADAARAAAERRAETAERTADEERQRAATMADLLGRVQENEAAARRLAEDVEAAAGDAARPSSSGRRGAPRATRAPAQTAD